MSSATKHLYEFGPFRLDTAERLLLRDGQPVPLTPKTFDTLVVLVEKGGHLVEKEELINTVWPDAIVEEGNLCVTISMLRKALGTGRGNKYIETVSKRGYRFVVDVREVPFENADAEQANPGAKTEIVSRHEQEITFHGPEAVRAEEAISRKAAWRLSLIPLAASLLLAGVALTLLFFWIAAKREPAATGDTLQVRSIAVLPFKALGANSDDEYLGLGMADTLIIKLGNTGQIVVRPTSAVLKYTDPAQDARAAGREQGVDAVLDGHIQREGERMRVGVKLVRVSDGAQLWADTFDEKSTNIFAVQDAISEKVTQSIRLKLTGEKKKLLAKRDTDSIEAYQAYVKGRYFWNKRTEQGLRKGAEYFQKAIDLDPTYAQAHTGLADSYAMLSIYTVLSPKDAYLKAKQAATEALRLDEGLAEAHASLGVISFYNEWDGQKAEQHFKRAFEINPNYAIAHMWYGLCLTAMGRLEEASAEMKRAHEIDPLSLIINTNLGWPLYLGGQYDQAIEAYKKALEMDPNFARAHFRLGLAYEQKRVYDQAITEFQEAFRLSGGDPEYQALVGHAWAMSGKKVEARKMIDQLKKLSEQRYVPPYGIALIYLALGEKDRAFEWLEKALKDRSSGAIYLKIDPMLNVIRSDPRFEELERHFKF